jgi:winged helix DNA-binding protein
VPANPARTLTRDELNRALLARQLLLERAKTSLPRALERIGGIQAQYAPSMYTGLWSRVEGFARDDLTRALERRTVVQGTLMRATIHLVSAGDYWPLARAIGEARRQWWISVHRDGPQPRQMAAAARRLRMVLADEPRPRTEIEKLLGRPVALGVGMWIDLVRAPPSGTWERRRADLYAAAESWLGPAEVTVREALEHLVRRYLGGFGPASAADLASWAGLPPHDAATVLERLDLRRFRAESGKELHDLPRAPLPPAETPAPARFLPTWDATLLAHTRRAGILPEEHRAKVFNTKTPHSVGTFLVDGTVAGTWRYERGRVLAQPFGRLDAVARRDLREEAERLAAFHG